MRWRKTDSVDFAIDYYCSLKSSASCFCFLRRALPASVELQKLQRERSGERSECFSSSEELRERGISSALQQGVEASGAFEQVATRYSGAIHHPFDG